LTNDIIYSCCPGNFYLHFFALQFFIIFSLGHNFPYAVHFHTLLFFMSQYRHAEYIMFPFGSLLYLLLFYNMVNRTETHGNHSEGYFFWSICRFVLL
jgi:hypothetical protein